MRIIGIQYGTNSAGETVTTLHGSMAFDAYHNNVEAGRKAIGEKVETVYAGTYDCSALKVGMDVEVMYGKPVATKTGFYAPIKRIDILSKQ